MACNYVLSDIDSLIIDIKFFNTYSIQRKHKAPSGLSCAIQRHDEN